MNFVMIQSDSLYRIRKSHQVLLKNYFESYPDKTDGGGLRQGPARPPLLPWLLGLKKALEKKLEELFRTFKFDYTFTPRTTSSGRTP